MLAHQEQVKMVKKNCLALEVASCLGAITEFSKEAREIVILDIKLL
jgi:hypothetical protein